MNIDIVSKRFEIGKTTSREWKKRRKKTGDFQSKFFARPVFRE